MRTERTDTSIAKHVDAIQALIRPDTVLALFCLDQAGQAFFVAPPGRDTLISAALAVYSVLDDQGPEST